MTQHLSAGEGGEMPEPSEGVVAESSVSPPRRTWSWMRRGVAAVTVASVAVIALLAANGWSAERVLNTCIGQDEEEQTELRPVVTETLEDVDHQSSDYYGCEDTGQPGDAAIYSEVLSWRQRSAANEYLTARGWIQRDFVTFQSPNGRYSANVVMCSEANIPRHVCLHFKHTA